MKKFLLSLAFSGIALLASATDFYVAESFDNTNNKFNTISAAIAAASDGDRIYVQDKPGAGYVEDLSINKSLSLINMNNNEKFTVSGEITTTLKFDYINLINIELNGKFSSTTKNINIHNSVFYNDFDVSSESLTCTCSSSLFNGGFRCAYINNLKLFGNIFNDKSATSIQYVDSLFLVGNTFNNECIVGGTPNGINTIFNNNFLSNETQYSTGAFLRIQDGDYLIYNNNFDGSYAKYPGGQYILVYSSTTPIGLDIRNNIFSNNLTFDALQMRHYINGGFDFKYFNVKYNIFDSRIEFYNSNDHALEIDTTNKISQFNVDSATCVVTGGNINAGDPDPLMSDLDLTRNDAGCYGGPYSFSNYFPRDDNGARVYWIDMPRRFFTGSTVNIKAYGVDK